MHIRSPLYFLVQYFILPPGFEPRPARRYDFEFLSLYTRHKIRFRYATIFKCYNYLSNNSHALAALTRHKLLFCSARADRRSVMGDKWQDHEQRQ